MKGAVLTRSNSDNKSRISGQSVSSWQTKLSEEYFNDREPKDIDKDFRSLVVYVYKNGDEYDKPLEMTINRRLYKHWISFLETLTKKLKVAHPINFIYTIDGKVIPNFRGLKDGEMYVAAWKEFKKAKYGSKVDQKFKVDPKLPVKKDPLSLESAESIDLYMKKMGYKSKTGLPYPMDMNEARIERISAKTSIDSFMETMKTTKQPSDNVKSTTKTTFNQAVPIHNQASLDKPRHFDPAPLHRTASLPDVSASVQQPYDHNGTHRHDIRRDTVTLPSVDLRNDRVDHRNVPEGRWSPGRSYPGDPRRDPYYHQRDQRDYERGGRDQNGFDRGGGRDQGRLEEYRNARRPYSQERLSYNDRYDDFPAADQRYRDDRYDDRRDFNPNASRGGPTHPERYDFDDRRPGDFDRRGLHVDETARLPHMGRSFEDISGRQPRRRDEVLNARTSQLQRPTVLVNPPSAKGIEQQPHRDPHRLSPGDVPQPLTLRKSASESRLAVMPRGVRSRSPSPSPRNLAVPVVAKPIQPAVEMPTDLLTRSNSNVSNLSDSSFIMFSK